MSTESAQPETARRVGEVYGELRAELAKVIVGQQRVIEEVLICILAGWALSGGGGTGVGEDAAGFDVGEGDGFFIRADSVYAGLIGSFWLTAQFRVCIP